MGQGCVFVRVLVTLVLALGVCGTAVEAAGATAPTVDGVRVVSVTEPGQSWVEVAYAAEFGELPSPLPIDWYERVVVVLRDAVTGDELGRVQEEMRTTGSIVAASADPFDRWMTATVTVSNPDGTDTAEGSNVPAGPPVIEWVWSQAPYGQGAIGEEMSLVGDDLGEIQATSNLYFEPGHIPAPILSWSDHTIEFTVPEGADTGTVHVETIKGRSQDWEFRVLPSVYGHIFDAARGANRRPRELPDARVQVREKGKDAVLDTCYTVEDGGFELAFPIDADIEYSVTVTLQSEDERLVMKRDGTTVWFSRDVAVAHPTELEILCTDVAQLSGASMPKQDVENAASLWHWVQLNRRAARALGRDLPWTLTVNAFDNDPSEDGTHAFYRLSTKSIYLGPHVCDDDTHAKTTTAPRDADPPPWQFIKNRETHEFGHALMHAVMAGGWVESGDKGNHAGYCNSSSGDSLSEGFAEFWSLVADRTSGMSDKPAQYDQYDGWGYLTGAGARKAWAPFDPTTPAATPPSGNPKEEFAVAGLLRSLQTVLGNGSTGFGKIVASLPTDGAVTDLHDLLVGAGASATAVDPLFFEYGFFADKNGNWTRDAGEPVGAGNGAACRLVYGGVLQTILPRPDRRDFPYDPDSFVKVTMSGAPAQAASMVTVHVRHAQDADLDFSVERPVVGPSGLVFVYLDPKATSVRLTADGADGEASPDSFTLTADEWKTRQANAQNDVALTATFRVDRIVVGTPKAPRTMRRGKAAVVTGSLLPRHEAGTSPVRVVKYLLVGRKWKSRGFVAAKVADATNGSTYSCRVKLTTAGKWRLRAFAPADDLHKAAWSKDYDYVTVR